MWITQKKCETLFNSLLKPAMRLQLYKLCKVMSPLSFYVNSEDVRLCCLHKHCLIVPRQKQLDDSNSVQRVT